MSTDTQGYNRETLLAMLHSRIVEIKFRKATGELRVLRGTLQEDLVPKFKIDDVFIDGEARDAERTPNPNLVTVWDLDANGWRSVRTDRIIEVL